MSRKIVLVLAFLVVLLCFQNSRFQHNRVDASNGYPVHNFNTGLNYSQIQEAMNAPETLSGHTIFVEKGLYRETLYVDKSLALVGEDRFSTIVDAGGFSASAIYINVGHVNVTGFTFQNTDEPFGCMDIMADHCVVTNNTVLGNGNGSSGIWLYLAEFTTLNGNLITDFVSGVFICDISTNNNIIMNNIIANNSEGFVMQAGNSTLFEGNTVTGNEVGIDLQYDSVNNTIRNNNFSSNGRGVYIFCGHDNFIYQNNFINNTDDAYIFYGIPPDWHPSNIWDNGFEGNFWGDYNGTDNNHDGIGDMPYIIDENNIDHYPLMAQYVIPEFPAFLVLPLFMIATLLVIAIWRRHLTLAF